MENPAYVLFVTLTKKYYETRISVKICNMFQKENLDVSCILFLESKPHDHVIIMTSCSF